MKRKIEVNPKLMRVLETLVDILALAYGFQLLYDFINIHTDLHFTVFVLNFCAYSLSAINARKKRKIDFVKYLVISAVYLVIALLLVLLEPETALICTLVLYFASIIFVRVISIIKKHKVLNVIINIILILLMIYLIVAALFSGLWDNFLSLGLLGILISFQMLIRITVLSFSHIRFDVLAKVLKKSMALEILSGLLILIVSFSFAFTLFEAPELENYLDALWYCFAIVTTIGFGDFTAYTVAGRILSAILGIYGIIVVALITSVIVNFYNEVNKENDKQDEAAGKKKAEDERAESEKAEAKENTEAMKESSETSE